VSDLDERIRRGLRQLADTVGPDLVDSRAAVFRKAARRAARRRVMGTLAAAVAVVIVVLVATFVIGGAGKPHGVGPATKSLPSTLGGPDMVRKVPNPFTVLHSHAPKALALVHPLGLAFSPDGNYYVTDKAQTVTEITPSGEVVRSWGRPGTGPGQFRLVSGGIAVGSDGRVYVADTGNFRVQVFSADGAFLRQFGSFGTGPGQFLWPSGIDVDTKGDIYVADDRVRSVTKLGPSGKELWRVGGSSSNGDLLGHEHLAGFDPTGRLVMANDDKGRVVYLDAAGHEVDAFGSGASGGHQSGSWPAGGGFPDGACESFVDAVGFVYVDSCEDASAPHRNIEMFDSHHTLVGAWLNSPLATPPQFGAGATALAIDHNGSIVELRVSRP
jgi:hypothetical protein